MRLLRSRIGSTLFVVTMLAASACSARTCGRVGALSHEAEVAALAKERGFSLVVHDCRDASRGGSAMEGVFSCLTKLDATQKQKVVDGFHLARPVPRGTTRPPVPAYTPTDNFTCAARFTMALGVKGVEVETLIADEYSTPGVMSVELAIEPSGEACLQFERTR